MAPASAIAAASQRQGPTRSPSSGMARIMQKTGLRETDRPWRPPAGSFAAAANISVTPVQPTENAHHMGPHVGLTNAAAGSSLPMATKAIQAKRKRPKVT